MTAVASQDTCRAGRGAFFFFVVVGCREFPVVLVFCVVVALVVLLVLEFPATDALRDAVVRVGVVLASIYRRRFY